MIVSININGVILVMVLQCVYNEIGTEFLCINHVRLKGQVADDLLRERKIVIGLGTEVR
jgi:hypothetical protein